MGIGADTVLKLGKEGKRKEADLYSAFKSNFHYTDLLVTSSSDELAGKLRGSYGLVANF